ALAFDGASHYFGDDCDFTYASIAFCVESFGRDRPTSDNARRSTNSICPLRLRSSSSAHFWIASRTSGSMRRRNALRSAKGIKGRGARGKGRERRHSAFPRPLPLTPCPSSLLVDRAGINHVTRIVLATRDDQQ